MENDDKNIHPESFKELCHLLGRTYIYDSKPLPKKIIPPPRPKEYEEIFHKKIPSGWMVNKWYLDLGFCNFSHVIAYCIYHNISMEELRGKEFTYPPKGIKVRY